METVRLGIDVVSIARLEQRLVQWPRLSSRLFTPGELDYAWSRPHPSQHLAVRLAAKEATFKALGSGWPQLSWLEIEVLSGDARPELKLSGKTGEQAGSAVPLVSLSHDAGIALAQVLLLAPGAETGLIYT